MLARYASKIFRFLDQALYSHQVRELIKVIVDNVTDNRMTD